MTFVHGSGAVFKVDDSTDTLRDISAFVESVEGLPGDVTLHETQTLGDTAVETSPGLRSAGFSVNLIFDATIDGYLGPTLGQAATLSFEYGPAGGAGSAIKYSGECRLADLKWSAPVGDMVKGTANFKSSGAIARGTF
jgi:hypothetical protein